MNKRIHNKHFLIVLGLRILNITSFWLQKRSNNDQTLNYVTIITRSSVNHYMTKRKKKNQQCSDTKFFSIIDLQSVDHYMTRKTSNLEANVNIRVHNMAFVWSFRS